MIDSDLDGRHTQLADLSACDPFDGPAWRGAGRATHRTGRSAASRRRLRRRRQVRRTILFGSGMLLLVGAGWLVISALMARKELMEVKGELGQLRAEVAAGRFDDARVTAADLARHAHRAHRLTTGPAWAVAAAIPEVGDPAKSVRGTALAADRLATTTVPGMIPAGERADVGTVRYGDQIRIAAPYRDSTAGEHESAP